MDRLQKEVAVSEFKSESKNIKLPSMTEIKNTLKLVEPKDGPCFSPSNMTHFMEKKHEH